MEAGYAVEFYFDPHFGGDAALIVYGPYTINDLNQIPYIAQCGKSWNGRITSFRFVQAIYQGGWEQKGKEAFCW